MAWNKESSTFVKFQKTILTPSSDGWCIDLVQTLGEQSTFDPHDRRCWQPHTCSSSWTILDRSAMIVESCTVRQTLAIFCTWDGNSGKKIFAIVELFLCYLWLSNLVFISVYGNYAWQIFIFHRNFMARFFAMKSGFKIDQSSIPSPKICNTCNWNLYFNPSAVLHIKVLYFTTKMFHNYTLILTIQIVPSMKTHWRKELFTWNPLAIKFDEERIFILVSWMHPGTLESWQICQELAKLTKLSEFKRDVRVKVEFGQPAEIVNMHFQWACNS